jgi:alpha-mannosidase
VHREAEAEYAQVAAELEEIIGGATAVLTGAGISGVPQVFNTSPRDRAEVVIVPAGPVADAVSGGQRLADGGAAVFTQVAASASAKLPDTTVAATPAHVTTTTRVIDNGLVRVEFDESGQFSSVRDLVAGREVLAPGEAGNLLRLHADLPNAWDAWDVDAHYRRQYTDLTEADEISVVEDGPLLGAVRITRSFGRSRIAQTVRVRAGSRRVDIVTDVDWHETEKLLKAAFPIDVHADRHAAEIQFGHVYRPTHTNTSWDAARFEVYAHRWIHVAEAGYGVAVLNDSTYGHDVTRDTREDGGTTTTVRLSLLRAARSPDPNADQGNHRFTYSLLPGASVADAIAEGYALNLPLRVIPGGEGTAHRAPLVRVTGTAATIEAVKLADDASGDVVVRLYESLGGRTETLLHAAFPVAQARVVDLLERPTTGEQLPLGADGSIAIALRPFQILTLRLARA